MRDFGARREARREKPLLGFVRTLRHWGISMTRIDLFFRSFRLTLFCILLISISRYSAAESAVLLVSLDGFRWDYFERGALTNLHRLAARGVRAKALVPVFPSDTFPSHYSMLTGLHPEHHGIVGNDIIDPSIPSTFAMGSREVVQETNWWLGEPIWITAQKQGLRAATCFWPGSDAQIGGTRPTYWLRFDATLPNEKRVAQIIDWLSLPKETRPQLLTLYIDDVDKAGHRFGPNSLEVEAALRVVDKTMGLLFEKLKAMGREDLNVIIVSDHGMTESGRERAVVLEDYIDGQDISEAFGGPVVLIYPRAGKKDFLLQQLQKVPHARFYAKESVPERFHFRDSPRIAPIVGIVDEGWVVVKRQAMPRWLKGGPKGMHGFDNQYKSMHGIFLAVGPAFQSGITVEPFLNLHVYELTAKILAIKPAPNDGSIEAVRTLLK